MSALMRATEYPRAERPNSPSLPSPASGGGEEAGMRGEGSNSALLARARLRGRCGGFLQLADLGADRSERPELVLVLVEAVDIGAVGRVGRLLQSVRKILGEVGLHRPLLAVDVAG